MLTPEMARTILHAVNLQINSNIIAIKPSARLNVLKAFELYRDTNRALK